MSIAYMSKPDAGRPEPKFSMSKALGVRKDQGVSIQVYIYIYTHR